MSINRLTNIIIVLIACLLTVGCIEDEADDFTSEDYYPFVPKDTVQTPAEPIEPPVEPEPTPPAPTPTPVACGDSTFEVTRSEEFISQFTRYGDGWTGGDATYSIQLPDGKTLWLFGDTFLGTVRPDRSRPGGPLSRNTFVMQDGEELTTFVKSDGSAFISPEEPGWWYWPTDGTVVNDTLQVLLSAFRSTGQGGIFGFEYARVDLALFALPDLELISITPRIEEPTIAFGSCVLEDDEYIYIYGAESGNLQKFANIARAANGDLRNDWEYYDGVNWVTDIESSAQLMNDVSEQFGVFKDNGHYYMITHDFLFGDEIYIWDSPTPVGPWGNQRTIYCTPETQGNRWTYNSFIHPQFTENDEILISYNINSFNFPDLFANADYYRPYFIRVGNWR